MSEKMLKRLCNWLQPGIGLLCMLNLKMQKAMCSMMIITGYFIRGNIGGGSVSGCMNSMCTLFDMTICDEYQCHTSYKLPGCTMVNWPIILAWTK